MIRFLLGILYFALVIWAVVDLFNSNRSTDQKILWLIVIVLFPLAGSVIYYVVSRRVI